MIGAIPVRGKDTVPFRCNLCGRCCENVKDSIMLEPMDAFRLARFFHGRSGYSQIQGVEDVYRWFAHPSTLEDIFPIYLLNTHGKNDACVFLEKGRCTVYEARSRVCRLYPFAAFPGARGKAFDFRQCLDAHAGHFSGGRVTVQDWMYQNFTKDDRAFVTEMSTAITQLSRLLKSLSPSGRRQRAFQVLYYYYFYYNLDQPFLPQDHQNIKTLCMELKKELSEGGSV